MKKFDTLIKQKLMDFENIINTFNYDAYQKDILKSTWLDNIYLMEYLAKRHFRYYNIFNLITIIGGILIPVIVNVIQDPFYSKFSITILGVTVSIAANVNQSYKFNERWKHFRAVSEELKIEGENFFSLTGKYKEFKERNNELHKVFLNNVIAIRENQIESYWKVINKSNKIKK